MRRLLLAIVLVLAAAAPSSAAGPQLSRAQVKSYLLRDVGVAPGVKRTIRDGRFHAGVDRLLYADLTGDGSADTVVTIFSGGTAGDIAFYVLTGVGSGLHAIKASNSEYKIGVQIVAGRLQVIRPLYGATDPNCCPSHIEITTYRYDGRKLVSASRVREKTPSS